MSSFISHLLRGFAMGSADIVPGVSGGTVALVLGIYRRLVGSIRMGAAALGCLVTGDVAGFRERFGSVDWRFLIPLGLGIGLAILSLSHLIENLLETQPVRMAGLFFGLVVASIIVATGFIGERTWQCSAWAAVAAVVTFMLLGFRAGPVSDPSLLVFLGAGAVAICAMILPGISGSFVLLMIGMYEAVLGAVNDRDLVAVVAVGIGAVVGLALFSTALNRLLEDHHDLILAILVGLMAGSLRVLWPWPDGTAGTSMSAPSGDIFIPVVLAIVGAVVVVVFSRTGARLSDDSMVESGQGT